MFECRCTKARYRSDATYRFTSATNVSKARMFECTSMAAFRFDILLLVLHEMRLCFRQDCESKKERRRLIAVRIVCLPMTCAVGAADRRVHPCGPRAPRVHSTAMRSDRPRMATCNAAACRDLQQSGTTARGNMVISRAGREAARPNGSRPGAVSCGDESLALTNRIAHRRRPTERDRLCAGNAIPGEYSAFAGSCVVRRV